MLGSLDSNQRATVAYIAPFLAFVTLMTVERMIPVPPELLYPLRFVLIAALIGALSWPYLSFRPSAPVASIAVGIAVFLIWIGPDLLFGYRHFWLFDNSLTGSAHSSLSPALKKNIPFLAMRTAGAALLVPVLEELFWRGWMMRWLIDKEFLKIPLGTYVPSAFWIVAILFASEHGPYWEVGLAAGVIYNWWVIRTKNLADCILAHAVTNAVLSIYVLFTDQWQYWL